LVGCGHDAPPFPMMPARRQGPRMPAGGEANPGGRMLASRRDGLLDGPVLIRYF
jgi:hypothetical protein